MITLGTRRRLCHGPRPASWSFDRLLDRQPAATAAAALRQTLPRCQRYYTGARPLLVLPLLLLPWLLCRPLPLLLLRVVPAWLAAAPSADVVPPCRCRCCRGCAAATRVSSTTTVDDPNDDDADPALETVRGGLAPLPYGFESCGTKSVRPTLTLRWSPSMTFPLHMGHTTLF